jgi:hypothetical protein
MTPEQVGEMTLYQIKTLTYPKERLGSGVIRGVSPKDAERISREIKADREAKGI